MGRSPCTGSCLWEEVLCIGHLHQSSPLHISISRPKFGKLPPPSQMSTADGQAVMSPLPLGSSPFMQGILETNTFPANEQRHNITAPVECSRSSRLQAVPAFKQEMSQSIAIPGRPGTGTSTSTVAEGNPDFRPSSAGDVSHSCAHLSRRSSSGLLQGSSNVRPASAVDRLYSSSTSSAGGEGLLQASTGFRPASAGGTCSSSASPSRQGGSGLLQARLNVTEALGKDIPYTISVNGSPPSDADQETLISRRNPSSVDRHSMSKNPAHYSSTLMEPNEEGDGQRLLTSLKSHRASSFRHREDAAGLSRKLQRALQACERARRQVMFAHMPAQLQDPTRLQRSHCLVSAVTTMHRKRCRCAIQTRACLSGRQHCHACMRVSCMQLWL